MNSILEMLIDMSVVIAAIWAAGKVIVSIIERWKRLGILSDEVHDSISKLEGQLKTQWRKYDEMEKKLDARLDKAEQQINYLAGICRVNIDKIREPKD